MRIGNAVRLLAVASAAALAGCGGGSKTITETAPTDTSAETTADSNLVPVKVLSPPSVKRCLEGGDATVISSEPLNPGEPINAVGIFAIGSKSGARIGIVLTLKPFITKRLARELAEAGEYSINVTQSEEAVVVLDDRATPADEALASECSET